MEKPKFNITWEHLCEVDAYAEFPAVIGESSVGNRMIFAGAEGGSLEGERLKGTIRAGGGDWARIRPDYGFELDVRLIIDTDDGAVIYMYYSGIIDMTKEQVELYLSGTTPEKLNIFITPKFETSHEKYQWLTKACVVGLGRGMQSEKGFNVKYSWYLANNEE